MTVEPGIVVSPDADGLVGGITDWPSDTLPGPKYRFADGVAVLSRTTFSLLFSRIGTRHNIGGEPADSFRVPNRTQRVAVGRDPADADFDTVGEKGGTKAATMPTHGHAMSGAPGVGSLAVSPASHNHTYARPGGLVAQSGASYGVSDLANTNTGNASLSIAGAPSAGTLDVDDASGSGNNMPPYDVTNYIVKVL